jgi:peptide/nickel transport system permease protein
MSRTFPIPTRKAPPRYEYAPPRRRRVWQHLGALVGLIALIVVVGAVLLAPWLSAHDPLAMDPPAQLQPPSLWHPAGTDLFGRDVLSRLLFGGRISLLVGAVAVLIGSLPGTLLGLLAGYYGGRLDGLVMAITDILLAFPGILLAMAIVSVTGNRLSNVILAVGIAEMPGYTRLARGQVLAACRQPYVRSAITVGCRPARVIFRHVLPNVLQPLVVMATLGIGWAILNASALSFLGLGVQPPSPEWGAMLREGRNFLREAPWVAAFPGLALALVVLAVNLLGDALRDALDPRLTSGYHSSRHAWRPFAWPAGRKVLESGGMGKEVMRSSSEP